MQKMSCKVLLSNFVTVSLPIIKQVLRQSERVQLDRVRLWYGDIEVMHCEKWIDQKNYTGY